MNYTLKMFNTGQITLPKRWRTKFSTTNFLAKETKDWFLIKPIIDDEEEFDAERIMQSNIVEKGEDGSIYYEDPAERGVFFPNGIDPQVLLDQINQSIH